MSGWKACLLPDAFLCSKQHFCSAFGAIYEHSRWVAESVWPKVCAAELATYGAVAEAMAAIVAAASEQIKLNLLCEHPELAGRAALAGELTAASNREQRSAGLGNCTPDELARIQSLNADYRRKFGFPFIIAVTGLSRGDILAAMHERLANSREREMAEALRQVDRIAEIRLAALVGRSQECTQ